MLESFTVFLLFYSLGKIWKNLQFLSNKMETVGNACSRKNIRGTRKYFCTSATTTLSSQVKKWMNPETDLKKKIKINPKALSTHAEPGFESHKLNENLYDWKSQQ